MDPIDKAIDFRTKNPRAYNKANTLTDRNNILAKIYDNSEFFTRVNSSGCLLFTELFRAIFALETTSNKHLLVHFCELGLSGMFTPEQYDRFRANISDIELFEWRVDDSAFMFVCSTKKFKCLVDYNLLHAGYTPSTSAKSKFEETINNVEKIEYLSTNELRNAKKLESTGQLLAVSKQPTVYFIVEEPYAGRVKIGHTYDLGKRLKQLQTGSPAKLRVYDKIITLDCKSVEKTLHKELANSRAHGEWFTISRKELLIFIENAVDRYEHDVR